MKICVLFLLISLSKIILPRCVNSRNYCSKCDPITNLCAICAKKDIFIPDDNGGCVGIQKCVAGKSYCAECTKDEKLCEKCDEGLYPDENGGCSNTNYCSISYNGECLKCKEDYILLGSNSKFRFCKSNFSDDFLNCENIDTKIGSCSKCKKEYFLNAGDGKCIKTENCYESVFGNCIKCIPGFYYNKKEDKCIENKEQDLIYCEQTLDGKKCDICEDNYYLDENGYCSLSKFCSKSENGVCTECIEGYYLANNNICSNTENCFHADKDLGVCLNCENHFYLDKKDYICKSNQENNEFKYCLIADKNENDEDYKCISCEWTYYLGKDSKCCNTRFCEESEDGLCILCEEGYVLNEDDNLCIPSREPTI